MEDNPTKVRFSDMADIDANLAHIAANPANIGVPTPVRELTARVHAAARAGVGDLMPSTMRIPNADYTDPAIAEAELRTTFTAPLLVLPSSAVAGPGDFVAMDLLDRPVVVVRGAEGRVRVLLNVCRHRARSWWKERAASAASPALTTTGSTAPMVPWSGCPVERASMIWTRHRMG